MPNIPKLRNNEPDHLLPGTLPNSLFGWFDGRLIKAVRYIVPAIAVVWSSTAGTLHLAVSPWVRELDWRVSPADGEQVVTICRHGISSSTVWYAMPLRLPKGFDQLPAFPGKTMFWCKNCLRVIDQLSRELPGIAPLLNNRIPVGYGLPIRKWGSTIDEYEDVFDVAARLDPGAVDHSKVPERYAASPVTEAEAAEGQSVEELEGDDPDPEQPDQDLG